MRFPNIKQTTLSVAAMLHQAAEFSFQFFELAFSGQSDQAAEIQRRRKLRQAFLRALRKRGESRQLSLAYIRVR